MRGFNKYSSDRDQRYSFTRNPVHSLLTEHGHASVQACHAGYAKIVAAFVVAGNILHPPSNAWMDGVLQPRGHFPRGFFLSQSVMMTCGKKIRRSNCEKMRSLPRKTGSRRPFPQSVEWQLVESSTLLLAALRRFFFNLAATYAAMGSPASGLSKDIGEVRGIPTVVMRIEQVSDARLRLKRRGPDRSIHGKTSIDG